MAEEDMKIGISYCRKSISVKGISDEQSVNYQQEAINRYADQHGIEIIQQYNDVGYSGKNMNRSQLQKMLEDLEATELKVDYILFYSIDRLGRDLTGNITTILEISEYADVVVSVSENLTNNAEYFKMLFLLLTGQAQAERENLLKRLSDGREAKIIKRKSFNGNQLPLGYVRCTTEDTERLVPAIWENTDDYGERKGFEIVYYIFYSYFEGKSLRNIADMLNRYYGLTRRQTRWSHKSVRYILSNVAYIGDIDGILNEKKNYYIESANIEPIVDSLMFGIIQRRLKLERSGRKASSITRSPLYNLCMNCASPLATKENKVVCVNCRMSMDAERLKEFLIANFQEIINRRGERRNHDQFLDLRNRYEWKLKKLSNSLLELDKRYKVIKEMSEWDAAAKSAMIQANTKEANKLRRELQEVGAILHLVVNKRVNNEKYPKPSDRLTSTRLIRLAYLIFIDMDTTDENEIEVEVLFHEDLFTKGQLDD